LHKRKFVYTERRLLATRILEKEKFYPFVAVERGTERLKKGKKKTVIMKKKKKAG